jgi:flagellar basal body rod protein FlgC
VAVPEVDPIAEISAQMQARQAYAASAMTFKAAERMDQASLDMSA